MDYLLLMPFSQTLIAVLLATQLQIRPIKALCFILATMNLLLLVLYLVVDMYTGAGLNDAFIHHLDFLLDETVLLLFWKPLFVGVLVILFVSASAWYVYSISKPLDLLRAYSSVMCVLALLLLLAAIVLNPVPSDIKRQLGELRFEFYENQILKIPEFFSQVKPPDVDAGSGNKKRSFIYIYAESLEKVLFDDRRFPGLMPELSLLKSRAFQIAGIQETRLTGWTSAAMGASQCGVPGNTFPFLASVYDVPEKYVPGMSCWGDFLSDDGYDLVFMGGADLDFQRKNQFFADQGFNEITGKNEFLGQDPDLPMSEWGLYDDFVISKAKQKSIELAQQERPFGLIILTLDTHGPNGFMSPSCKDSYPSESGFLKAAHCSDKILGEFIGSLLTDPKFRDVVIVLSSDHLVLGNDAGLKQEDASRENLWVAFNTEYDSQVLKRRATMLDIAPTFLTLIGYQASHFALGRNLLGDSPTLRELYGDKSFEKKMVYWRWNIVALAREKAINMASFGEEP